MARLALQPRVRLGEPAPEAIFASTPARVARITFALMDGDEPEIRGIGPFDTAVIAWPCDDNGYIHVGRLHAGDTRVLRWRMSEAEIAAVRALHVEGWRFATSDLLVTGGPDRPRFHPTPRSFRLSKFAPLLEREVLESIAFGDL